MKVFIIVFTFIACAYSAIDSLPSSILTPGDTVSITHKLLCCVGYDIKNITKKTVDTVFRIYGIPDSMRKYYVIDHLIPKAIGGSNSIKNLWPQYRKDCKWTSYMKDALERNARKLVCRGRVNRACIQSEIAKDWIAAYRKYVKNIK